MDQVRSLYDATVGWLLNIIWLTDPSATYAHPEVQRFWSIAMYITDALAVLFFVVAGYQIMLSGFGSRYAQVLDQLPRVVFALVGAHMSLYLAALVIDLNNYLCAIFVAQRDLVGLFIHTQGMGPFLVPLLIAQALLMLFLVLQMVARIALLDFLLVVMPWLVLLLANRSTEHIGRAGIEAYISATLMQSLQLLVLVMGERVMLPFFTATIGAKSALTPVAGLVLGIALFWLVIQLPVIVGRIVLHPVARTGEGVRTVITFLVARLL